MCVCMCAHVRVSVTDSLSILSVAVIKSQVVVCVVVVHRLQCDCQHNTCGVSCDQCCHGHNQLPWKPATTFSANECEREYTHTHTLTDTHGVKSVIPVEECVFSHMLLWMNSKYWMLFCFLLKTLYSYIPIISTHIFLFYSNALMSVLYVLCPINSDTGVMDGWMDGC